MNKIIKSLIYLAILISQPALADITKASVEKWVKSFDNLVQARNVKQVSSNLKDDFSYVLVAQQAGVSNNLNKAAFLKGLSEAGAVKIKTNEMKISLDKSVAVVDLKRTIVATFNKQQIERTISERMYLYLTDNKLMLGQIDLIDDTTSEI